ncbi:tetratricopeptide repeat protein [Aneurinibacillus tyrosinisolvens]|uniref:tetratricopeptide repeat protein n=1 Tax=Aneurinibacillus tyrosinisolvens TaxID=1443435 RepID=UPI00063F892D|nr:tetratricopeptide repeat protein [Aneurinibacillus tyrosinisolvens]
MGKQMTGSVRNIIIYILIVVTVGAIIYGVTAGSNQDEKFIQQSRQYRAALENMQAGQFGEAEKTFKQLLAVHQESYIVMWNCALSLLKQDKYDEAAQYFVKTQKQRPFVVREPRYLVEYGETLYKQGQYPKAKRYLEEAKELNAGPELLQQVQPILTALEKNAR